LYTPTRLVQVWLLLLFSALQGSAQEFEVKNYTLSDGFIPNDISYFYQDAAGFLWIGQHDGLARFDGRTFHYFSKEDGLTSLTMSRVTVDRHGDYWFATIGNMFRYKGHRFQDTGFPQFPEIPYIMGLWELSDGTMITASSRGFHRFTGSTWEVLSSDIPNPNEKLAGNILPVADTLYFSTNAGIYRMVWGQPAQKILDTQPGNYTYQIADWGKEGILITQRHGTWIYQNGQIHPKQLNPLKEARVALKTNSGETWVYYKHGGLALLDDKGNERELFTTDNGLSDNFITTLLEDRDGNLWVANNAQLIRIRRGGIERYQRNFDLKSNGISDIKLLPDSSIFVSGYSFPHGIFKNSRPWKSAFLPVDYPKRNLSYLTSDSQKNIWYIEKGKFFRFKDGQEYNMTRNTNGLFATGSWLLGVFKEPASDDMWMYGNVLWKYHNDSLKALPVDTLISRYGKFSDCFRQGDALFFVNTSIFLLRGDAWINLFPDKGRHYDVTAACIDSSGNLWVGTDKLGVMRCRIQDDKAVILEKITELDGLPNPTIFWLTPDPEGNLWAATPAGLCRIWYKAGKTDGRYRIQVFQPEGKELPATKVIAGTDKSMWAISANALWRYDLEALNHKIRPETYISDLQLFQQKTDWSAFTDSLAPWTNLPTGLSLNYQQNSLTFHFNAILFQRENDVRFTYRLNSNRPGAWSKPDANTEANYLDLPPGKYSFEVKALMGDGTESKISAFSFTILPPFWQTWWFLTLVLLTLLAATFLIFKYRIAAIRKEEAEKTERARQISEIELTSIRAQMNPHFVFNALNSIQDFVLHNNAREASRYLTKFARLIRLALDNADKTNVTAANTMEFLQHYIDLESLRFPGKFTYELETDPEIDAENILIPNMMIQPHVENAIWHGIMHRKEEGGQLEVRLAWHDDTTLVATVYDNGVGRPAAAKINAEKRAGHRSKGTILVQENLRMINQLYHTNARVEYEDLTDADGLPLGTRVRIYIPVFKRIPYAKS
jgi:ligand-binding sensor domain-containing protein/two-component sensor histidine kinase